MRTVQKVLILSLLCVAAACSRDPKKTVAAATPTSPTGAAVAETTIKYVGGVAGPNDIAFPSRAESFLFRVALDPKYQSMGRSLAGTTVDREGEVVWLQEYIRYRVNGCDHATAVSRVLSQIDGNPPGGICDPLIDGIAANYPPRNDVLDMRRVLELKYQTFNRSLAQTFVDIEGASIWITEYLRYRTSGCDHETAMAKVFAQIDGAPPPPTCFVPCNYVLNPGGRDVGSGSLNDSFEIRPNPTACAWTASSDASWLTIPSDYLSGNGYTVVPYSVAINNGGDRQGRISFSWAGGGTSFVVYQAGTPFVANLVMVDPFRGAGETTECHIQSASTPCNFTVSANLPGNNYTYNWTAQWVNGIPKSSQITSGSNQFSISEQCGGSGAAAGGQPTELAVSVMITDDRGNTVTVTRSFTMFVYTC